MAAFLGMGLGSLGHLIEVESPQPAWVGVAADGAVVAAVGAVWSAVRAHSGRPPMLWLPAVTGAAVSALGPLAADVAERSRETVTGVELLHAGAGLWALAAAWAVLRGPMLRYFGGVVIALALGSLGVGLVVRLVLAFATDGEGVVAGRILAPGTAALAIALALAAAGIGGILLRSGESGAMRPSDVVFDPALGVRTHAGLAVRGAELLQSARDRGHDVVVAVVDLTEQRTLAEAFGARTVEAARSLVAAVLLDLVPRGGAVGLGGEASQQFVVLLPDHDLARAERWARDVRRAVRASRVEVDGEDLRLTVATGLAAGDGDLDALAARARVNVGAEVARGR
ncbi:GGDEF domain-containing protein [Litorihabitans aurantiacus]|uniref:GGDEF domain-containing protein n=1 Tax=Litorihabitans aurantiacus TaxID=1930061 RepID=A0AA37XCV8_9MICO|nr:hypothetical protein [Litorihabitans aurantiacus]GMA30375.1 hypothetical protein GCM10025875_03670 [Litorihabitans aurantiacus]